MHTRPIAQDSPDSSRSAAAGKFTFELDLDGTSEAAISNVAQDCASAKRVKKHTPPQGESSASILPIVFEISKLLKVVVDHVGEEESSSLWDRLSSGVGGGISDDARKRPKPLLCFCASHLFPPNHEQFTVYVFNYGAYHRIECRF